MAGNKVSVVITVFEDRSYDFIVKTPPVSGLILKAAGVEKGSGKNTVTKAGKITKNQAKEIAEGMANPLLNLPVIGAARESQ